MIMKVYKYEVGVKKLSKKREEPWRNYSELNGSKHDNIKVIFGEIQEFPSTN